MVKLVKSPSVCWRNPCRGTRVSTLPRMEALISLGRVLAGPCGWLEAVSEETPHGEGGAIYTGPGPWD
jgi:hypothetical protein